jgi:hypothetical protein
VQWAESSPWAGLPTATQPGLTPVSLGWPFPALRPITLKCAAMAVRLLGVAMACPIPPHRRRGAALRPPREGEGGSAKWAQPKRIRIRTEIWIFQICPEFDSAWRMSSQTWKFQIKYGSVGFEIRNKFSYWHFYRFKMNFELKFKQGSKIQIQVEFDWILCWSLLFDEIWTILPISTLMAHQLMRLSLTL